MKGENAFYYKSEKDDFFSQTKKPLPDIDENYKYKEGFVQKILSFICHRIIAPPIAFFYIKLVLREKYIGKEKLKPYKKKPYLIYLNHTQPIADAVSPNILIFPKKLYIIVNKENLALPVIGKATARLGALPLPDNLKAARNFSEAIAERLKSGASIAIYPEAHVWPYYTGIREFGAETLEPAIKNSSPVFTFTRVYKKKKDGKKPRHIIYVDGPFFPDSELTKREAREKLRLEITNAMRERASLSDCEYIKYIKAEDSAEDQSL